MACVKNDTTDLGSSNDMRGDLLKNGGMYYWLKKCCFELTNCSVRTCLPMGNCYIRNLVSPENKESSS